MDYPIIKHNTTQKINDLNYTNRLNEIYRFIKTDIYLFQAIVLK